MNLGTVWAFAQTEIQLTRRLVRYWIFLALAYVIGIGLYLYFSVVHAVGSSISASIGFVGPRYLISSIGFFYLATFIVGTIFLAFDIRARDARAQMIEVLDSRPYSNVELVVGRFIGLFLLAWVPLLLLVALIQGLGVLLPAMNSPIGRVLEPASLLNFATFVAIPAISVSCALSMAIALLVRQQFIALVLSLAVIAVLYFASLGALPYAVSTTLDLMGFYQLDLPSDWLPEMRPDAVGTMQRVGMFVVALGILLFAAVAHPRLDDGSRVRRSAAGAALAALGLTLLAYVFVIRGHHLEDNARWLQAHLAVQQAAAPDIVDIRGRVAIRPGRSLAMDLDVQIRAPGSEPMSAALFSLNPGLAVVAVTDANGGGLDHEFHAGLLTVTLSPTLPPQEIRQVKLQFTGAPDNRFGYLDSPLDLRELALSESDVELLGNENGIFDARYVALMPGIHWLPAAGPATQQRGSHPAPRDFFYLSLEIEVPAGWLVAGPGLRHEVGRSGDTVSYRFSPPVPLAEVAVLAAPFERFHAEIDGIVFELLVHPQHAASIQNLAPGVDEIRSWVAERLGLARAAGLEYPFDSFSMVEVPNSLRGFAGGWQMASTLAPPSMVLMKETSLPTARFDFNVADVIRRRAEPDGEEVAGRVMLNRLYDFFINDFTGGNVFTGIAESFFAHRLDATGGDAIALNYTMSQLATLVVSGQRSYFSVERIADLGETLEAIIGSSQGGEASVPDRVISAITSDEAVWRAARATPLSRIDPWDDPRLKLDVLALKAGAAADFLYEYLGPKKAGRLLSGLLESHAGAAYRREDIVSAGVAAEADIAQVLDDWFADTGLPGFIVSDTQLYQLPDTSNGDAQIQLRVTVANGEPVTGFVRIAWSNEANGDRARSTIIRVPGNSAIEYGVVLLQAPVEVLVEPFMSLNRGDVLAGRFAGADIERRTAEPVRGVRTAEPQGSDNDRLIVDDLDSSFGLTGVVQAGTTAGDGLQKDEDQAMPFTLLRQFPPQWTRLEYDSAWGAYRKTLAIVGAGDDPRPTRFSTALPEGGQWSLELHMPTMWFDMAREFGEFQLAIVTPDRRVPVRFDASSAQPGWNHVGQFELPANVVAVELAAQTSGRGVVADAIAWSPVNQ